MKKTITLIIVLMLVLSMVACGKNETETETTIPVQTSEPEQEQVDWEYDQATKTLYVNVDMGAFEPDAPDFDGTTSNAPWAEYLQEIESIVVGDEATFIGDYAFAFCTNLKNVEVGRNVTALDLRCFFKCGDFANDSSIDMYFNSTPEFGEDVFGYTWDNPNVVIYVPDDMKDYWADYIMQKGEMKLDGYDLQPKMPESRDDVLFSMLLNPQELFYEGRDEMADNEGGQFGFISEKRVDDERLELFSGDGGAFMPLNTRLRDFGSENRPQQAIMMRFQPENVSNLNFTFIGMGEFVIGFKEDGLYFTDVKSFMEMPFSDYIPNNFSLNGMSHYYILVAIDEEAKLRTIIWEDGMYENQAYFEYSLYQGADDIFESNWQMNIGFDGGGQLNIYEYWVYTFDNFMDNSLFVSSSGESQNDDMQNGDNDYGPSWSINIAGNFDIMSDLVWQSVEGRELDINGEKYVGYNLAEIMEFSGNASDTARVIFGDTDGSDIEVNPTSEAFIVFKKNDEFLGGPFLLINDVLMEHPVIQVQID